MIEDGMYSYLAAQATIVKVVDSPNGPRIFPTVLPQTPSLPAIVFLSLGTVSAAERQDGPSVLDRTRFQIDCYHTDQRKAKLLANSVRAALEAYVGPMGSHTVRRVAVLSHNVDDFDDVPNDFRITSEYEVWHTP